MKKLLSIGLAVVMTATLLAVPVWADKTMDQIEKTGKIKLGFREGSIPFAFVDPKVADEIIFMDFGRIVERGTYEAFFNNPKSERAKDFLKQIL